MANEFERWWAQQFPITGGPCEHTIDVDKALGELIWLAALATHQQPQGDTCKAEPKHSRQWLYHPPEEVLEHTENAQMKDFGCENAKVIHSPAAYCLLCHHAQVLAVKEAELTKVHECNIGLANLIAHRQPPSVLEVRSEAYGEGWQAAHNPLLKCGHPSACYQDRNWPESEKNYDPATKTSNPPTEYQCVMCEMQHELSASQSRITQLEAVVMAADELKSSLSNRILSAISRWADGYPGQREPELARVRNAILGYEAANPASPQAGENRE